MAWRVVDSVEASPGSKDVGASWRVRLERGDEKAEVVVDVTRTATTVLDAGGWVAGETRRALGTRGKSAVRDALAEGGDPPAWIVCSTEGCHAE